MEMEGGRFEEAATYAVVMVECVIILVNNVDWLAPLKRAIRALADVSGRQPL